MPLVTGPPVVRARLGARPEPPFDRFYDPLVDDLVRGGPFSRERFATNWSDTAGLERLARAKRRPLPGALGDALIAYHKRLGASPRSLESLERLARGEATAAVAGQQPGPLGGPLYSLHKTASAVGLAALVSERTGVPCVPLFWMHGEDSDFAEIRSVLVADSGLAVEELEIPERAHREGQLVGAVPTEALSQVHERCGAVWAGLPSRDEAMEAVRRAGRSARDLGEAMSALWLALFGERGLVVVDPRLPEFRDAARPVVDRYLAGAEELSERARRAGDRLERDFARRPLAGPTLDSFVFAIEDSRRRKLSVEEARRAATPLSPSVALRAALQDGVFPTVAMACGAAEISYLAQLREVFEGVGVAPACPVPRLTATWLPPAAVELLEAADVTPGELITDADAVLKRLAERETPEAVRAELEAARAAANQALRRFAESAQRVEPSLPQMVESARAKVDYQYARLWEGLIAKVRHRLERQHPAWPRLRYYLTPGDRLQERRLASLEVVAYRGARVVPWLCDQAEEQARRLAEGVHEHLVLEL